MKVLIAEDDRGCRELLVDCLTQWGYDVVATGDGAAAWEALRVPDGPRLAILDWMMPLMDGLELCRKLRETPGLSPLYVVFLTAKGLPEDLATALANGADDYVSKPFAIQELRARIQVGVRMLELQGRLGERVDALQAALDRVAERTGALQVSEARIKAVVENARDCILAVDGAGIIRDVNPAGEACFRVPRAQLIGRPLAELMAAGPCREACERQLEQQSGTGKWLESVGVRDDGEEFPIELSITTMSTLEPPAFSAFVRDITARKRLEVELRHAQKLESVGQLASGIAHEINTPIQFVGDNVRFLADSLAGVSRLVSACRALRAELDQSSVAPDRLAAVDAAEAEADWSYLEQEIPKAINQTLEGVGRVAAIVRAMKDFAHPHAGDEKMAADLNQALRNTLTVARNELKYVAEVETEFGDLPPVLCYVGDLNQVFLNLLVNAAHAIADVVADAGTKGRIVVRTVPEGKTVLITVGDTGGGIAEAIRDKVFDPFFTTKGVGRGTGQGLAIARAIVVEKHGGTLAFETTVGKGTTFMIRLPVGAAGATRPEAA